MILHTIGGRYVYSEVPYDAWSMALIGYDFTTSFGWTRNHYDRLVHFAFGTCCVFPVLDIAGHRGSVLRSGLWLAGAVVLSLSCLYEIFEWLLTIVMAGDFAARYNGQQGDIWDAQKDMALAFFGYLSMSVTVWWGSYERPKTA